MPRRKTAPTAHKPTAIRVGLRLRGQRLAHRLSLRHFARTLGLAPGRLSNIEGASSITDPTTAAFMLGGLGTDYATAQRIITAPAHNAASDLVDTDHDSHAAIAWHYEQVADRVTVWAPTLIPDLLRTPEHDLALITHQLADTGISDTYTLALPQRLEALTNPRRHYTFLLGDTALRACTPALRKRQIGRLRLLAEQRHITIRVVPAQHCPPGLVAPFTLYEQTTTAIAVAIHHHYASTYLTNPGTLVGYRQCARLLSTLDAITISDAAAQLDPPAPQPDHSNLTPGQPPITDTQREALTPTSFLIRHGTRSDSSYPEATTQPIPCRAAPATSAQPPGEGDIPNGLPAAPPSGPAATAKYDNADISAHTAKENLVR